MVNGSNTNASGLSVGFLSDLRRSAGLEDPYESCGESLTNLDHAKMQLALKHSEVLYVEPIGRGVHRPYRVKLGNTERRGVIDCSEGVFKTVSSQYETRRYRKAVDLRISGPEREILAYDIDKATGFNLIPPTVGRHIDGIGYGSLMAWVQAPLAIDWIRSKKYIYRDHSENSWLHLCAAFDFIVGNLDRHAANWLLDKTHKVFAIDNGYAFPKGEGRRYLKSNIGKNLVGKEVHPNVIRFLHSIDKNILASVLSNRGFRSGEEEGVLKRFEEMCNTGVWRVMGDLWDPERR